MASGDDKTRVDLDAEIVERTRSALGADAGSDAAVIERALNAYLLGRLLDAAQTRGGLSESEADRIAARQDDLASRRLPYVGGLAGL
jgi:hypothetical protein